jgi:hypothetical protein
LSAGGVPHGDWEALYTRSDILQTLYWASIYPSILSSRIVWEVASLSPRLTLHPGQLPTSYITVSAWFTRRERLTPNFCHFLLKCPPSVSSTGLRSPPRSVRLSLRTPPSGSDVVLIMPLCQSTSTTSAPLRKGMRYVPIILLCRPRSATLGGHGCLQCSSL